MSKDVIVDKLKEAFNFIVCVIIALVIARMTGFLGGFTPKDFQEAFTKPLNNAPKTAVKDVRKKGNAQAYNNYQPSSISNSAFKGAQKIYAWKNLFNSDTKSVFYIYDDISSDKEFHYDIQNSITKSSFKINYNIDAYSKTAYKNIGIGESIPSKICDTLEECKEQRENAANYAALTELLERCGRTMCVINPQKRQYVILKRRDSKEAMQMLNALKDW